MKTEDKIRVLERVLTNLDNTYLPYGLCRHLYEEWPGDQPGRKALTKFVIGLHEGGLDKELFLAGVGRPWKPSGKEYRKQLVRKAIKKLRADAKKKAAKKKAVKR